jgi:hypothetical protein
VLGVGCGASVARDEELATGFHGGGGELGEVSEGVGDGGIRKHGLQGGDGLCELLVYDGRQRGLREVHPLILYGRG